MANNNEYKNVLVAGVWPTKNGNYSTMALDAKAFDTLSRAAEMGGKILIRKRSEQSMAQSKNPDATPPYFLEIIPASEVKKFEESRANKNTNQYL